MNMPFRVQSWYPFHGLRQLSYLSFLPGHFRQHSQNIQQQKVNLLHQLHDIEYFYFSSKKEYSNVDIRRNEDDSVNVYYGNSFYLPNKYYYGKLNNDGSVSVVLDTNETRTVKYYYEKVPSGIITVKYVDIETEEEIKTKCGLKEHHCERCCGHH